MGKTKRRTVSLEGWIANAVDAWAEKSGRKSAATAVNAILDAYLNKMGYFRADFEPGIVDHPLHVDNTQMRKPVEKPASEKLAFTGRYAGIVSDGNVLYPQWE